MHSPYISIVQKLGYKDKFMNEKNLNPRKCLKYESCENSYSLKSSDNEGLESVSSITKNEISETDQGSYIPTEVKHENCLSFKQ